MTGFDRTSPASDTCCIDACVCADWIHLISDCVAPAIPDFTFGHATDAAKGQDGFCVVKVQVHLCFTAILPLSTYNCWAGTAQVLTS